MRDLVRLAWYAAVYGIIFGVAVSVSCLFFLHYLYGFSLVPCQFDWSGCQAPDLSQALRIPVLHIPSPDQHMVITPLPSRLLVSIVKAGGEG
jgi:hypothetical protein